MFLRSLQHSPAAPEFTALLNALGLVPSGCVIIERVPLQPALLCFSPRRKVAKVHFLVWPLVERASGAANERRVCAFRKQTDELLRNDVKQPAPNAQQPRRETERSAVQRRFIRPAAKDYIHKARNKPLKSFCFKSYYYRFRPARVSQLVEHSPTV